MEVKHPQRHAGASPPSALHVVCVLLLLSLHRAVAKVGSNAGCTFQACGDGWSCYAPTLSNVSSGQYYWSGCSRAYSYVPNRVCNYQPCLNECTSNYNNGCLSTCAPYTTCNQSRSTCETACYSAYYNVDLDSYEECWDDCYFDEYNCDSDDCGCYTSYVTCSNVCYTECHTGDNMLWWNSNCTTAHLVPSCIDFTATSIMIGGNAAGQFLNGTYNTVNVLGTATVNISTNAVVSTVKLQSMGNCSVFSGGQVDTLFVGGYNGTIDVQPNGYVGFLNASNYNPLIRVDGTVEHLLFSGPLTVEGTGNIEEYQQYGGNLTYAGVGQIDEYEQTGGNATFTGSINIGDYELNYGNALYVGNGTFDSYDQTAGTATFIGNMQIGDSYHQVGGNATFNGDVVFVWYYEQKGGTALFTGNVKVQEDGYSQNGGTALFTGTVTLWDYDQTGGNATFAGNGTIEEFTNYGGGHTIFSGAMIIDEYDLEDNGAVVFGNRTQVATARGQGTFFIAGNVTSGAEFYGPSSVFISGNIQSAVIEVDVIMMNVTSPGAIQSIEAYNCDAQVHLSSGASIGTFAVTAYSSNIQIIGEVEPTNGPAPTVGQYQQALSSILTLEGAIRVGNISGTGTFLVQATSSVCGQLALLSANGINNTVVVSTGAFVNNLTGAGNITIGGNVTSVYVTNGVTQNTTYISHWDFQRHHHHCRHYTRNEYLRRPPSNGVHHHLLYIWSHHYHRRRRPPVHLHQQHHEHHCAYGWSAA